MRILIVEDDRTTIRILTKRLAPLGKCEVAEDGREGVQMFQAAWNENEPYDLICMDIKLPELDGPEVLKVIREYEDDNEVPPEESVRIIIVSANSEMKNVLDAHYIGKCSAFLVKPIDPDRFEKELRAIIRHEEAAERTAANDVAGEDGGASSQNAAS